MREESKLLTALMLITIVGLATLLLPGVALAAPSTGEVLHDILADRGSPMAEVAYTPAAFWRNHTDFDIAGWLAVVWAETNLGKDSFSRRTFNIGCIRGGKLGRPWRDWRVAVTAAGYNIYPSLYVGQRAHILLVYSRYNQYLSAHDWNGFAQRYWGPGYPASYISTLKKAHALIVSDARARGLAW